MSFEGCLVIACSGFMRLGTNGRVIGAQHFLLSYSRNEPPEPSYNLSLSAAFFVCTLDLPSLDLLSLDLPSLDRSVGVVQAPIMVLKILKERGSISISCDSI